MVVKPGVVEQYLTEEQADDIVRWIYYYLGNQNTVAVVVSHIERGFVAHAPGIRLVVFNRKTEFGRHLYNAEGLDINMVSAYKLDEYLGLVGANNVLVFRP